MSEIDELGSIHCYCLISSIALINKNNVWYQHIASSSLVKRTKERCLWLFIYWWHYCLSTSSKRSIVKKKITEARLSAFLKRVHSTFHRFHRIWQRQTNCSDWWRRGSWCVWPDRSHSPGSFMCQVSQGAKVYARQRTRRPQRFPKRPYGKSKSWRLRVGLMLEACNVAFLTLPYFISVNC